MIELIKINSENRIWINKIKGKKDQLHLVHYNAHWFGQSKINDDIEFLLAKFDNNYVGLICFGQYYLDEYLQEKKTGFAEIIHIVIDAAHQSKGYSKQIALQVISKLKKEGYKYIYVAISNENKISNKLWKKLGFKSTDLKNYDGDSIFILDIN